ncbi:MAG: transcription antitermination factor NusB [Clostridiales bacterium]|nr:transcription antitermination factor NusB [Clostridiales bacterium]
MSRITARAAAMQLIYEKMSGGQGGEESLQMVYDELRQDGVPGVASVGRKEPGEEDREYIARVLEGVISRRYLIDEKIENAAQGWTLERMPLVDLTIMRLAVWEMMYEEEVPGSVSIAEALELTERYSDPEDKKFVNGVLGTILRELEGEK